MQPVSHGHHTPSPRAQHAPPAAEPDRPGKSAQSVGHHAKAAVAVAREAGVEVPKNAQGIAASQIASGADPASLFAAQVDDAPTDTPEISAEVPVDVSATPIEDPIAVPEESAPPPNLAPQPVTDAEAALELLTGDAEPET